MLQLLKQLYWVANIELFTGDQETTHTYAPIIRVGQEQKLLTNSLQSRALSSEPTEGSASAHLSPSMVCQRPHQLYTVVCTRVAAPNIC